ncbi:MAG: glucose-1-phosphate cytidylyltransferase [Hyphomicrobiales bacterium]|nr:glucose-1-phosphate cytidylyltransferase [Hyphomicrobiales bacterium]
MKAVLMAGGLGTRFAEETVLKPKPMIEIGGRPILWHIMKIYAAHGVTDFIVCLGYKGYSIKEYFQNYYLWSSDVTFDLRANTVEIHASKAEPWRVTLVDTGEQTMIGGRLKRVLPHVGDDEAFCMTYGDGVGDVDIRAVIDLHRRSGRLATVTAVQPPGRFGALETEGDAVTGFREKPVGDGGWINGGFFVLSPKVGDWIEGDQTIWEREPLERLAAAGQLGVHHHHGFWQPMDTLRDKRYLEDLWAAGDPPWRIWE